MTCGRRGHADRPRPDDAYKPGTDRHDAAALLSFDLSALGSIEYDNLTDITDFSAANAEADTAFGSMVDLWKRLKAVDGIGAAKASKLLHLRRPNLFPIIDSQIIKICGVQATMQGRLLGWRKRDYWSAIALDVQANGPGFVEIRDRQREHADADVCHASKLTDVRLQDVLAWEPKHT